MTNTRQDVEKLMQQLAQQRDELQLKVALAKLEVRDEWEKLEAQWQHLKANAPQVREELGTTLHKTAEDIRAGYERLRKLL